VEKSRARIIVARPCLQLYFNSTKECYPSRAIRELSKDFALHPVYGARNRGDTFEKIIVLQIWDANPEG